MPILKIFIYKFDHVHAEGLKLKPSIETQPNNVILMLLAFYYKLAHLICSMATALDREFCDKIFQNKQVKMESFKYFKH